MGHRKEKAHFKILYSWNYVPNCVFSYKSNNFLEFYYSFLLWFKLRWNDAFCNTILLALPIDYFFIKKIGTDIHTASFESQFSRLEITNNALYHYKEYCFVRKINFYTFVEVSWRHNFRKTIKHMCVPVFLFLSKYVFLHWIDIFPTTL